MKKKFKCKIWSDSSNMKEYVVETSSAMKAAAELGRCESGEVVRVETLTTGRIISEARWTPENGGKYYRCEI